MIRYNTQFIDNKDIKQVIKSLKSDLITTGQYVKEFELDLKKKFNSKHCVVLSSGTAALHLSGIALGWNKYSHVITSPITFAATANSALYLNSKLHLVDINLKDYTIDLNCLEKKLKKIRSRSSKNITVIGVDYAGHPCDWESMSFLSKKYKTFLMNDNCHAIGAKFKGNIGYAAKYSDIATQSYHPVKNITTGEGGSVLTNNHELYNKIKNLRSHGIYKNKFTKKKGIHFYDITELGYNFRLSDINCALGISQLKKLDFFISKRNQIASYYLKSFSNLENIFLPQMSNSNNISHAYHLFPVRINFKKLNYSRSDLFRLFNKNNIFPQVHYIPIYMLSLYKNKFRGFSKKLPNSYEFYNNQLSLPLYVNLSFKKLDLISKLVKFFLARE